MTAIVCFSRISLRPDLRWSTVKLETPCWSGSLNVVEYVVLDAEALLVSAGKEDGRRGMRRYGSSIVTSSCRDGSKTGDHLPALNWLMDML